MGTMFRNAPDWICTERQAAIDAMVAAGKINSNWLTENVSLVLAPIMYAVFAKMAFGVWRLAMAMRAR